MHGRNSTSQPREENVQDVEEQAEDAERRQRQEELNSRLLLLWNQFESFMTLTTSLQAQHDAAQSTILNLQAKVVELEDKVKTSQSGHDDILSASASAVVASAFAARDAQTPAKSDAQKAMLDQLMTDSKKNVDRQWSSMREEWSEGQARLAKASEEWEAKIKQVDSKLATLNAVSDPPLANGADNHPNGT